MTEAEFFDNSFIGKEISFIDPPSSWILWEKLSDKNDQRDRYVFMEMGGNSSAYGTFLCESSGDALQRVIVGIIMQ